MPASYIALHPLLAQPKALDPMADAGARMDAHLCPEDGARAAGGIRRGGACARLKRRRRCSLAP
ncbi:MAG: hypothetical protein ACLUHE_13405 [Christensenellales bacterium]